MADDRFARATVQIQLVTDTTTTTTNNNNNNNNDTSISASTSVSTPIAAKDEFIGASVTLNQLNPVKKKRGRPPRNSGGPSLAVPIPPGSCGVKRSQKEEEDVCFVCFDGGSLVLCDRRDCPKAYHPACIKRDESFFKPNMRWNCGWHLCNICQRNALFLCYTCPYSLCKGCVKEADIFCVRGNKGFCKNCMTTIMLIENIPQPNKELVKVDFDDATSWEYLFKVYWVLLKQKELFTSDELIQATNPWKASGLDHKNKLQDTCVTKGSDLASNGVQLEANGSKRRKIRKQALVFNIDVHKVEKEDEEKVPALHGKADWASKELLEFVAHMKNGDTSVLSQFDVQALLLDYIRTNSLRDPRQKCQIVCDERLLNLFGKSRVGHFEMLKLLEYHFKEPRTNGMVHGAAIDPIAGEVEINGEIHTPSRDILRQTRRRCDDKVRQTNLDSYAAIDAHNINLIYLKRNLLENLVVDVENFHDKVVGSVVKIRISSNDQRQDMHRLVRIIGTTKATESYKVGDKTEHVKLRILNLNKIEDVALDAISDQEFSEDECRRLRQSIKLGLVERMKVGEIQEKAMALQTVRVDGWLKTELTRLNHLRDRASEMGHKKELRECIEKIELLKSPEERQRRIHEIPEVHADPRMDPSYGSDDDSGESDTRKQDGSVTHKYTKPYSKVIESIFAVKPSDISKDDDAKSPKTSAVNGERKREVPAKFHAGKVEGSTSHIGSSQKPERVDSSSNHSVEKLGSAPHVSHSLRTLPFGKVLISDMTELERIWHYQDPSGKVQGPFCLLQLRKWNSSGFFPTDLRVWRTNESKEQSVLLNDALRKQHSHEVRDKAKNDEIKDNSDGSNVVERCRSDQNSIKVSDDRGFVLSSEHNDRIRSEKSSSESNLVETPLNTCKTELSCQSRPTVRSDSVDMESQPASNGSPGQSSGPPDSANDGILTSNGIEPSDVPISEQKSEPSDSKSLDTDEDKHPTTEVNNASVLSLSASMAIDEIFGDVSYQVSSSSCCTTVINNETLETHGGGDKNYVNSNALGQDLGTQWNAMSGGLLFSDLGVAASKMENEGLKNSTLENKRCDDANVDGQHSDVNWSSISAGIEFSVLPSASLKVEDEGMRDRAVENKHGQNLGMQNSCISWSTASNLVGDLHLDDVPGEWDNAGCDSLGWLPIELSTLGDESVSDLLTEVEAMESLRGISSPTSRMDCGNDSIDSPRGDCFSPLDGMSPNIDPGKNDASSSSADLQFHIHHNHLNQHHLPFTIDINDIPRTTCVLSNPNTEVEEVRRVSVSLGLHDFLSQAPQPTLPPPPQPQPPSPPPVIQPPPPPPQPPPPPLTINLEIPSSPVEEGELHPINPPKKEPSPHLREPPRSQENVKGSILGNPNIHWSNSTQGMVPANMNMHRNPSIGSPGTRTNQISPRYGHSGGRHSVPKDKSHHHHTPWSRQSSVGGGGGGSRPPNRGRVCKFYESGYCKRGASCKYLHP